MASVVGLSAGCLRVWLGLFFPEFVEVSVLSFVVHCCGKGFSSRLHICGGFVGSLYSGLYALLSFLPIVPGALVSGRVRGF